MNEIRYELSFFPPFNLRIEKCLWNIKKIFWLLSIQVACWLLDPDSKEPTLHGIVTSFLPHELPLLEGVETGQGIQSLGLNVSTELSGRYRASVESILIFNSMNQLNSLLKKENLQGKTKFLAFLCYYRLVIIIYLVTLYHRWINFFILLMQTISLDCLIQGSTNFSVKVQIVNIFGFTVQMVSIANTQLCHHIIKATIDNMKTSIPKNFIYKTK